MAPNSINNHHRNVAAEPQKSFLTPPRPDIHAAATVIPTLPVQDPDPSDTRSKLGERVGILNRRSADSSAGPKSKIQLPHLQIDLANAQKDFLDPRVKPLPENSGGAPSGNPTAPIAIPQRAHQRPITPLTGRPKGDQSRNPFFTQATSWSSQNSSDKSTSPLDHANFFTMGSRSGNKPSYRPSSPLSPSMPVPIPRREPQQKDRPPQQKFDLRGLPRFHPLNFPNSESNTPLSPRSARAIKSQTRGGRLGSDAQQKLQQYQRTVIANTTRTAHSALSQGNIDKPDSPRLVPRESPVGPITPLMLEGQAQSDYLMAGSGLSPTSAASGRDLVEKLVRKENERRQHPEARSGSLSPSISPAVSPAVSPAGGRG